MTYTLRNTRELLQRLPAPAFFEQILGEKIPVTSPDLDKHVTLPALLFLQQLTFEMTGLLMELGIYKETDQAAAHLEHFPILNGGLITPDDDLGDTAANAAYEYAEAYTLLVKFRAAEPLCA